MKCDQVLWSIATVSYSARLSVSSFSIPVTALHLKRRCAPNLEQPTSCSTHRRVAAFIIAGDNRH